MTINQHNPFEAEPEDHMCPSCGRPCGDHHPSCLHSVERCGEAIQSDQIRRLEDGIEWQKEEIARLTQELSSAWARCRAIATKDWWVWQGDGTDHLESLVNEATILISARQLREFHTKSIIFYQKPIEAPKKEPAISSDAHFHTLPLAIDPDSTIISVCNGYCDRLFGLTQEVNIAGLNIHFPPTVSLSDLSRLYTPHKPPDQYPWWRRIINWIKKRLNLFVRTQISPATLNLWVDNVLMVCTPLVRIPLLMGGTRWFSPDAEPNFPFNSYYTTVSTIRLKPESHLKITVEYRHPPRVSGPTLGELILRTVRGGL